MSKASKYGIIEESFWDDPRFEQLSRLATLIYLRLWTKCSSYNQLGFLISRSSRGYLAVRFRSRPHQIDQAIAEIGQAGLWITSVHNGVTAVRFPTSIKDKYANKKAVWRDEFDRPVTDLGTSSVRAGREQEQEQEQEQELEHKQTKVNHRSRSRTPHPGVAGFAGVDTPVVCSESCSESESTHDPMETVRLLRMSYDSGDRKLRADVLRYRYDIAQHAIPTLLAVGRDRMLLAAAYVETQRVKSRASALITYATQYPIPEKAEKRVHEFLASQYVCAVTASQAETGQDGDENQKTTQ